MLSALDKKILNAVQEELPLVSRPFAFIAEQLHTDEETVLARLEVLKKDGFLRRIGAYFDSDALGYQGTLIALRVVPEKLPEIAERVNGFSGVTHNYEREGEYNLWFTLQTSSAAQTREIMDEISAFPGVEDMLELPSSKKYKVRVQFRLS